MKIFRVMMVLLMMLSARASAVPLVSVIVPVYKTERFLRECLDSILGQSLQDIEVICIDDASPDNCWLILREYAAKDRRVKIIRHEHNMGLACARNSGLNVVVGEYVSFVDSDDHIHPDMLKIMYFEVRKGNYDVAICNFFHETPQNRPYLGKITSYKVLEHDVSEWKIEKNYDECCNKLYRRSLLEMEPLRFIPGIIFEDVPFNICLRRFIKKYITVEAELYFYRSRRGSTTRSPFSRHKADSCCKIIELVRSRPDSAPSDDDKNMLCQRIVFHTIFAAAWEGTFDVFCYTLRRVYGLCSEGLISWKQAFSACFGAVCCLLHHKTEKFFWKMKKMGCA